MKINYFSGTDVVIKELGARIKSLRLEMNISQEELAERANISKRTVSNLENGRDVSFRTLIEVMRVLGRLEGLDAIIPEVRIRPHNALYELKPRKRASQIIAEHVNETEWKWGDEK